MNAIVSTVINVQADELTEHTEIPELTFGDWVSWGDSPLRDKQFGMFVRLTSNGYACVRMGIYTYQHIHPRYLTVHEDYET